MRVELRGCRTIRIGQWYEDIRTARAFHAGHAQAARDYLRAFARDRENCAALRRLLAAEGVSVGLLGDDEVIREAAARLANGMLRVIEVERPPLIMPQYSAPALAPDPSPAPQPRPTEPQRALRREPAPMVEPDTFASAEQELQAEVLEMAATEGTPFCEECERLRQETMAGAGVA